VADTGPRLATGDVTGEARLSLTDFRPEFENNFEADGPSRAKESLRRFCLAIAAGKIANSDPRKVSKPFPDFGKKICKNKPALPNNFSLGPKEILEVFDDLCF
jgi:hypothetical protein